MNYLEYIASFVKKCSPHQNRSTRDVVAIVAYQQYTCMQFLMACVFSREINNKY